MRSAGLSAGEKIAKDLGCDVEGLGLHPKAAGQEHNLLCISERELHSMPSELKGKATSRGRALFKRSPQ